MTYFACTENNVAPILDIVWGSYVLIGAFSAQSDPYFYYDTDEIIAVGVGWGILSGVSAAFGFKKSSACRAAKRALAERLAGGRPAEPGAVGAAIVQAVTISPSSVTLRVGERIQLVATAQSSSGGVVPNRQFAWSSSNDAIASVSNAGLVTANAPGNVVVAANTGNVVGTVSITTTAPQ